MVIERFIVWLSAAFFVWLGLRLGIQVPGSEAAGDYFANGQRSLGLDGSGESLLNFVVDVFERAHDALLDGVGGLLGDGGHGSMFEDR